MARTVPLALVALALIFQGCSQSAAAAEQQQAVKVFETFQDALFQGRPTTIRRLLTLESRQFAAAICRRQIAGRRPLEIVGTSKVRHQLRVHVRDPNDSGRESFFVLVKEDGSVRVDMVATTAYNKEEHRRPGPREIVRQKRLTRREIEKIRAMSKEVIR